jgi:inosine/xanthosine triphosphate pyrophosphatase family protein
MNRENQKKCQTSFEKKNANKVKQLKSILTKIYCESVQIEDQTIKIELPSQHKTIQEQSCKHLHLKNMQRLLLLETLPPQTKL